MSEMTGIERITNILNRKPVDRVGVFEHFWEDTVELWEKQGHIKPGENLAEHFKLDIQTCGFPLVFNYMADIDHEPETLEETDEYRLVRDGNMALLRWPKRTGTPEHVDFYVKSREQWEEFAKPKLTADPKRIDFEKYRKFKEAAAKNNSFFVWSGLNVFELMHPLCGHEHILMGMVMDPDWIRDMADTYAQLNIDLMEILFAQEGEPDGIWFYEDMGFKGHSFISPAMYKELIQPAHKKTIDYAKSRNLPVIWHSCGFVEPLIPGFIEAGIDCLQAIEIKSGMDLLKLYKQYGDQIAFMGGMDIMVLQTNDRAKIDEELETKMPELLKKFSYILHTDHSIPPVMEYDTYWYFRNKGLSLGRY